MVFPFIEEGIRQQIASAQAAADVRFIVLDAAIMLETGWSRYCQRLVFVDAPREVRLERLYHHRGWSAKEVDEREQAQMALDEKARWADHRITNAGPPEQLTPQILALLQQWGIGPA